MAFCHTSTFLRSALARDPFCHGDVISPEDVIRLEEKFPTLFDKPLPPPCEGNESDFSGGGDAVPVKASPGKLKSTALTSKLPSKGKYVRTEVISAVRARSRVEPSPVQKKPTVCKYHEKCFAGAGDNLAGPEVERKQIVTRKPSYADQGPQGRRVAEEEPSISLGDLKVLVRQFLQKEQRPKHPRQLDRKSQPSPYTEDLVKRFFGRKLDEMRKQKQQLQIRGRAPVREVARARPNIAPNVTSHPKKMATGTGRPISSRSSTVSRESVHRVETAPPGFIRRHNYELPRAPPPKLGATYQMKRTDSGLSVNTTHSVNSTPKVSHHQKDGQVKHKVTWASSKESSSSSQQPEVEEKYSHSQEESEDYLTPRDTDCDWDKPAAVRDTRVIHITCPKYVSKAEVFINSPSSTRHHLPKSNYNQLLAAHQAYGNLDTKAMLRRQEQSNNNFPVKQAGRMNHHPFYNRRRNATEDAPFKVDDTLRQTVEKKTTETLEKIAGELVYTEILHQLNELKVEQQTMHEMNWEPSPNNSHHHSETSTSSPEKHHHETLDKITPNFIPTTASEEDEGESEEEVKAGHDSEIILNTPDLTPTPTNDRQVVAGQEADDTDCSDSDEADEGSLKTPQLSPKSSNRENIRPPNSENVEDDSCEEVIDFIPSQASDSEEDEDNEQEEIDNAGGNEMDDLNTPQLSKSIHNIIIPKPPTQDENIPEKDESTLSGISTFSESLHRIIDVNAPNDEDVDDGSVVEDNVLSKYSDDFIPEMGYSNRNSPRVSAAAVDLTPPPVKDNPPEPEPEPSDGEDNINISSMKSVAIDMDSENENEDVLENLNTSRETVIDLLSEGEFIGDYVRSPGEVSMGQKWAPPEKLISPRKVFSEEASSPRSTIMTTEESNQSTVNHRTVEDDKPGQYEISIISEGAQLSIEQIEGPSIGEL